MTAHDDLINFIRRKGIGKTMSKSLDEHDCKRVLQLLPDPTLSDTSKTTLLVAFLMLDNTPEEQNCLEYIKQNYQTLCPDSCHFLFNPHSQTTNTRLVNCAHHILAKKDLSESQLTYVTKAILNPDIANPYKAAILEGLRLKEESEQENNFFLTYFYQQAQRTHVNVPILIDLATAYDGFNRHPNMVLAIAPLLAAIGIPTILHGCKEVSPKFGHTLHKCLLEFNLNPTMSIEKVKTCLEQPSIGWGYIDQSVSFAQLYRLEPCRKAVVKRPVLATIEKFMQPFFSSHRTCLVTGYTHPAYRTKTTRLLQNLPNCTEFTFFRGIEGSCLLPLDRRCPVITQQNQQSIPTEGFVSPEDMALTKSNIIQPDRDITIEQTCQAIATALQDIDSDYCQLIVYNALVILSQFNLMQQKTKQQLESAIRSGQAWKHFLAFNT